MRWRPAWRLGALGVAAGLASRGCQPAPRSIDEMAAMLGASVGGRVQPGAFVWEAPGSAIGELTLGRRVLFLAATEGDTRDLYRARVRLSFEGRPLGVRDVHPLTATPLGDESGLVADGRFASRFVAYSTASYGHLDAVTVLDLAGDGGVVGAHGAIERTQGAIGNALDTGALAGVGRTVLRFANPTPSVTLRFEAGKLLVTTPENAPATYDPAAGALVGAAEDAGLTVERSPHLRKAPVLWAVDTVRSIVGPALIARLEEAAFGARDVVRRTGHQITDRSAEAVAPADAPTPSPPLDASAAGEDGGYWPPTRLPSIWQQPEANEGAWEPVKYPFLRRVPGAGDEAPPYFYRTTIRPDAKRPYAEVQIVALDMRQLELNMEGGVEDPAPLTGNRGAGRIPRDPAVLDRVAGAFNGAFKTTHGAYGMMVNRRVLLPPKPGAASVIVTADHRVAIGAWGPSEKVPDDVVSFRQNLDPLVLDGKFNPSGRQQWGYQLAGQGVMTERSGVCVTRPGHVFYLWGDDLSGVTLGKAMVQAGCVAGMHLDMNPKHTGFVFADIRHVERKDYDARLLTPQMEILPERYIEWSPKDFFYVMRRDPRTVDTSGVKWELDPGVQPAPTWLAGLWRSEASVGEVPVALFGVDPGRVTFRVRGGRHDGGADVQGLAVEEEKRVVAAMGLGNGRRPRGLGLLVSGRVLSTAKGGLGYLATDATGELRVGAGEAPSGSVDAVELPLVVSNGHLGMQATSVGPRRERGAACVLGSGRAVFAWSTATSDEANAQTLARMGCTFAVGLDRGSHEEAWHQRAGVAGAAVARGEQTTLVAVGAPMRPRAFAWKP